MLYTLNKNDYHLQCIGQQGGDMSVSFTECDTISKLQATPILSRNAKAVVSQYLALFELSEDLMQEPKEREKWQTLIVSLCQKHILALEKSAI